MGTRLAFPATKNNSVEIAFISDKKLRYTFDKFAEKIDGRVLQVPSPHVKACDFLGVVEFFFGETMKKTTSCKKATKLPR